MPNDDSLQSSESHRVLLRELQYPVLFFERGRFDVFRDARSVNVQRGLFVDREGLSYQVVDVDRPFFSRDGKPVPRAERIRLLREGLDNIPVYVHYVGEPIQLSVEAVRQKIVWMVSARGHFEIPQGLPTLSLAESVEELIGVLLRTGFR